VDILQVKQLFPTTEDPFESGLFKDIPKCWREEFNFFCHDGSEMRFQYVLIIIKLFGFDYWHLLLLLPTSGHCRTFSMMTDKSKPGITFRGGRFRVQEVPMNNNLFTKPYRLQMSSEMHMAYDTMIINAIGAFS